MRGESHEPTDYGERCLCGVYVNLECFIVEPLSKDRVTNAL
jgi:hypothetical protein